ncbi:pilus assembly protein N-terminal domain-containing protein [Aureimonas psammosilenae]|uniref:pilus assembly protein N-terminal domain-containing protein n=1 Tax=Aureimonas psammosilenae TaxID=2495496 RepID=UPI0012613361|nr:pilus assembly protein N-terminal domain-containing protein [Aureimonas psammosilenae]
MHHAQALVLLAAIVLSGPASAEQTETRLTVDIDHARVLKVPRPAATVIIGNPAIADVSVQDASTMVLTGRSYGSTNLIVLDANGDPIVDEQVSVRSFEEGTVRIYRQAERQTYSCTPECEPSVTIGDTDFAFNSASSQFTARQSLANAAAAAAR